jgi:hypothetical protein
MRAFLEGEAPMSRRLEDQIQRCIFQHWRQRGAPNAIMFAVPNGGFRRPVEAAILRATGTTAGVPDICAVRNGKAYFLELKPCARRSKPQSRPCSRVR